MMFTTIWQTYPHQKAIQNVHRYEVLLKGDEVELKVRGNCQRKTGKPKSSTDRNQKATTKYGKAIGGVKRCVIGLQRGD